MPELTPAERQQAHRDRRETIQRLVQALPPAAQRFWLRWWPTVDRAGRYGPDGDAVGLLHQFAADLQEMLAGLPGPEKVAGGHQRGSGQ